MKKVFYAFAAALFLISCSSCVSSEPDKPGNGGTTTEPGGTTDPGGTTTEPGGENKPGAVTGVSLNLTTLELEIGQTYTLTATIEPADATNKNVFWGTDNSVVASVDRNTGLITAKKEGQAIISVITEDGDFSDECTVTVVKPAVPPVTAPAPYGAIPTEGQVAWQRRELLMFYHYGVATFSGYDGENSKSNGSSWSEALLLNNYNPTTIDCDQWVKTAADNGFKEIIITAKHHDGFCLWDNPESTTDVANPNAKNHTDVLAELRAACNKYGVEMGIYLSPWDRMIEVSGVSTSVYETRFKNAAKDLMTKYAPVVEFWLDGNHAGNFTWSSVNQVILNENPQCVIFSNGGPGCRWVGNENGDAGETNWGTLNIKGRGLSPSNLPGSYETYLSQGDRNGDSWCAAECDFSIQRIGDANGWFWGQNDTRKTAKQLMDLYYKSVGRNGVFLMNVPPSKNGIIENAEKTVIEQFTSWRNQIFGTNLAEGATVTATEERGEGFEPANILDPDYDKYYAAPDGKTSTTITVELGSNKTFNRVMLQEYIPLGQRVSSFNIQVRKGGSWSSWGSGTKTTIGHKRIILGSSTTADAVRINITGALACPTINGFGLYNDTVSGL